MTSKPFALGITLLLSVALAGEVQAAEQPGDSAASLSIKAVNVKVVNSSACSLEAVIGISNRSLTRTLYPGESMQYAGSGLPVLTNATSAKISSGKDCKQQMFADGGFVNPQIGEPFCLCAFDTATWQESFSVNQTRALADRTVGLRVQRNGDTSKFKNFTMTVTGNTEMTLTQRAAPATAWVYRTASRRHLRVRVTPKPERGQPWRFRVQKRQAGIWKKLPGTYRAKGRKVERTQALAERDLPRASPGGQWDCREHVPRPSTDQLAASSDRSWWGSAKASRSTCRPDCTSALMSSVTSQMFTFMPASTRASLVQNAMYSPLAGSPRKTTVS
jgi:hypothetical protein